MVTTTFATAANPLRTYQFRIGLLPDPPDVAPPERSTLQDAATAVGPPVPAAAPGGYVAGVRRASGLSMTIAATEVWEGGNALHRYANPNRATWEPLVLEQGLALDDTLERWADAAVRFLRTGTVDAAQPVKRNLVLDVWDPAEPGPGGQFERPARRYLVFNAWVSKFQAVPRLDAMADEVALLVVELTHEGWRPDPVPTFAQPS